MTHGRDDDQEGEAAKTRRKLEKAGVYDAPTVVSSAVVEHAGADQQPVEQTALDLLPPGWLIVRKDGRTDVHHLASSTRLRFEGVVADAIAQRDLARVRWLADVPAADPLLRGFAEDLERGPAAPMTRLSLLRGDGWRDLFIELGGSSPETGLVLSLERLLRALDDAKTLGFSSACLTGAEPLASANCVPVMRHIAGLGFRDLEIRTSGLPLSDSLLTQLLPFTPRFAFRLHSHDRAAHDAVTQIEGSHERLVGAIRRVLQSGLSARVDVIFADASSRDFELTLTFLRQLGLAPDFIAFQTATGAGHACARPAVRGVADGFPGIACIASDGRVYPCSSGRHLVLGDLRERSLQAVLEDATPVKAHLDATPSAWSAHLACHECRIRSALLVGDPTSGPSGREDG